MAAGGTAMRLRRQHRGDRGLQLGRPRERSLLAGVLLRRGLVQRGVHAGGVPRHHAAHGMRPPRRVILHQVKDILKTKKQKRKNRKSVRESERSYGRVRSEAITRISCTWYVYILLYIPRVYSEGV